MSSQGIHWAAGGFEAARHLGLQADDARCQGMHGHSFRVEVQSAVAPALPVPHQALQQRLHRVLSPLNYRLLNEVLTQPTDQQVLQWIVTQMNLQGLTHYKLWAGPEHGAIRDWAGKFHYWMRDRFEAAHRLPHVPEGHKCGRMHGHGFEVLLQIEAGDGARIQALHSRWHALRQSLHQHCLNHIAGLEIPTSEMISRWIWLELKTQVPDLSAVTVFETASCGAVFNGTEHGIWKDRSFDSAILLETDLYSDAASGAEEELAPQGMLARPQDKGGIDGRTMPDLRIYGHTYVLRLGLAAPLDTLLGWTVDFGDVKALFAPIFSRLDHHPLHEVLPVCSHSELTCWIYEQARLQLPALRRVSLWDTPDTAYTLEQGAHVFAVTG